MTWRSLSFAVLLCLSLGCSGGPDYGRPVAVQGKITQGGQPVSGAIVTFHAMSDLPAELRTRTATTSAEGAYQIQDVYPAEYKVMIHPMADPNVDPGAAPAVPDAGPLAKYGDESELRANVSAEKTTFDFEL